MTSYKWYNYLGLSSSVKKKKNETNKNPPADFSVISQQIFE